MTNTAQRLIQIIALGAVAFALTACGGAGRPSASSAPPVPAAAPIPSDEEAAKMSVRWLEDRVKRDPEDLIAHNKLAGYYLQFLRETGNLSYLDLATRAARASLAVLPAEMNTGGLAALAQAEIAAHEFAAARDHATQLTQLEPRKGYPFEILGDALLELGEYDKAAKAFKEMEQRSDGVGPQTRLAHYALLRGETELAKKRITFALALALDQVPTPREAVAWCRWQLGEIAFSVGDYETAEKHYQDALTTFPDYYRALASMGRVRAARGDLAGAIEYYERATRILPDVGFVAALGDLYKLAGRETEAAAQYALVEQIAKLDSAKGVLYNRQLALFYADHDMKAAEAYASAAKEYETRKDIYGADILAWTALKAGRVPEAQAAIKEALRLGTKDARLYYHAGMIARAAGDSNAARDYLERALKLSPQFDPLLAEVARKALAEAGK